MEVLLAAEKLSGQQIVEACPKYIVSAKDLSEWVLDFVLQLPLCSFVFAESLIVPVKYSIECLLASKQYYSLVVYPFSNRFSD